MRIQPKPNKQRNQVKEKKRHHLHIEILFVN